LLLVRRVKMYRRTNKNPKNSARIREGGLWTW